MKIISGNPYLKKDNGHMIIDQLYLNDLLKIHETPIIIFLENRLRDNIKTFKEICSTIFNDTDCFYSFKANFLPEICSIVNSEGIGAAVVGLPELNLALKTGFPPNKILVGGPYLPNDLIKKSIEKNVKEIIVYNLKDLIQINSIAKQLNAKQNICIRVNSEKYDSRLGIKFNEKNLNKLHDLVNKCQNIRLTSLLSHFSSQMNNIEQFKKNLDNVIRNLRKMEGIGIKIKNLNLGGGFPEATIMPRNQLRKIMTEIKKKLESLDLCSKNIIFEPGRYLVGDTGLLISKIIHVTDGRWIFLNIGNNICPKFARCSLRFYNASKIGDPHKFKTSIAGIVPTDQDVLAKNYYFTDSLDEKDIVLITNVGAYCLTFSNRFPYTLPKIFMIQGNMLKLIFDPIIDKDFSIS